MKKHVKVMLTKFRIMRADFLEGIGSFLGPGSEKKWYGTYSDKLDGVWDKTAEEMMIEFSETAHPIFRGSSALQKEGDYEANKVARRLFISTVANKTLN